MIVCVAFLIQQYEVTELGGIFQYIDKGRDFEKNFINKNLLTLVLNDNYSEKKLSVDPGTLILFYGRNYLHRVTPVRSEKCRILVTLNYNLEEGIELSENARLTFFVHLYYINDNAIFSACWSII